MKKLLTLLTTLLLLFAFSPRVMASKNVYLLTGNTVKVGENVVQGNWGKAVGVTPNSDLKLSQVGSTEEYCITLMPTSEPIIYFAFQVDGWKDCVKPASNTELTVNGEKKDVQYKGAGAWFVNSANSKIVIHVSLNDNTNNRKVWVDQNGGSTTPTASYYLIGKLLNNQWSDDNKKGYELTTTDNKIYSYTVNNDKADNYEFRFRIGTNDNTKAYHPKDGTVETSGDHKNGYKLELSTEAGMEQSLSDNYWYATLEARHSYTFTFNAENKTIIYKDKGDDGLGKAKIMN